MKIYAKIDEKILTNKGNPSVDFTCLHCGERLLDLVGFFHQSKFKKLGKKLGLSIGVSKFVEAINSDDRDLLKNGFKNEKTYRYLLQRLCHCDENVKDMEFARGVKRAKSIAILARGLEKLKEIERSRAEYMKFNVLLSVFSESTLILETNLSSKIMTVFCLPNHLALSIIIIMQSQFTQFSLTERKSLCF